MRGNSFDLFRSKGLHEVDPTISDLLQRELERQRDSIELIASESFTWPAVLEAESSVAANKYASGFPGRRFYPGCELVDAIELLAIERAKTLFRAEHANVQPYSGSLANEAVFMACLEPGDTILSLPFHQGGHPTHGYDVNLSGRLYNTVSYDLDRETALIDYEQVRSLALEHRPRLIICGGSAYPRMVEVERFRAIADEAGALLMCDMAHFAGLVAAGLYPNPVPLCDFVTSTTHKTLAGPRGGFVLCRAEYAEALDNAVYPVLQGGPLVQSLAAKATCFEIAASEAFASFQRRVRENADRLAAQLMTAGLEVVTGGTDTHLLLVDLRATGWSGPDAERRLHEVGVTVNAISVPFDERQPESTSGLRLGTPATSMRGFDQEDMSEVAAIIVGALDECADLDALAARAASLCERRPLYPGFDGYCRYSPGSRAPVRPDNVFAMDERSKRRSLPVSAIRVASAEA
jgi:glycine hydroxymethyltransferase